MLIQPRLSPHPRNPLADHRPQPPAHLDPSLRSITGGSWSRGLTLDLTPANLGYLLWEFVVNHPSLPDLWAAPDGAPGIMVPRSVLLRYTSKFMCGGRVARAAAALAEAARLANSDAFAIVPLPPKPTGPAPVGYRFIP